MNYLKEFVILCICLFLGAVTRSIIDFPIPEAVYGMIYLFIALNFHILKSEDVKQTADGILKNLAFLFVPAGVGILAHIDLIKGQILSIGLLVILGTALSIAVTGLVVQFLQRRKNV